MIEWLTDWLIDWLTDWMIEWLTRREKCNAEESFHDEETKLYKQIDELIDEITVKRIL